MKTEKINITIEKLYDNKNIEKELKKSYEEAKKDYDFSKLIDKLNLPDEVLMKYTSSLMNCAKEALNCKGCPGLFNCKNEIKGYVATPRVENNTIFIDYIACSYQQALNNESDKNVYKFDIPKEIANARMSEIFVDDKARIKIIEYLTDFIDNFKKNKNQKGLYLSGSFGTGKTYMIAAMFNEVAKVGVKSAIIYWPEFLRSLKGSFGTDFNEKFDYIKKVPLLLIDDIGAENVTSWSRDEILGPILQYRMLEELPTFFTSNFTIDQLESHFANTNGGEVEALKARRIIERIRYLAVELALVGKSRR